MHTLTLRIGRLGQKKVTNRKEEKKKERDRDRQRDEERKIMRCKVVVSVNSRMIFFFWLKPRRHLLSRNREPTFQL